MTQKVYQAGELVFQKGDPGEYAYIIVSGEIEILRDYPENPLRLATLKAEDIFGEMGLIDERPRSLTARAVSLTTLSTVTRNEFVELLQNNPTEALKYLRMFFERLRAMNMRAVADKHSSAAVAKTAKDFEITIFPNSPIMENFVSAQGFRMKGNVFRVGRNSDRNEDPLEINDLILRDAPPYNVSRNHFSIEKTTENVYVHDRGSYVGTIVNDKVIGGHHHEAIIELHEGENTIIVGTHISPFRFRVNVKKIA